MCDVTFKAHLLALAFFQSLSFFPAQFDPVLAISWQNSRCAKWPFCKEPIFFLKALILIKVGL